MEVLNGLIFAPVQTKASFCGLHLDLLLQEGSPVSTLGRESARVSSQLPPTLSCWEKLCSSWSCQDAPSRGASRLPLTPGWLERAGAAGAARLPWPGTMGSAEGNAALICILSPLAANQGARTLSRTGTGRQQGHGPDAGDRNWGQWEESGVQWEPQAGPCLALAPLLVLQGVI